jgi:hypothetical protein
VVSPKADLMEMHHPGTLKDPITSSLNQPLLYFT